MLQKLYCYKSKAITLGGEKPCDAIEPILSATATYYSKNISMALKDDGCLVFNEHGNLTQQGNAASTHIFATVPDSFLPKEHGSLMVIVQSNDEPHFRFMEQGRYLHGPGLYGIILNKVFMQRLEPPYPNQCSKDGEGTDNLIDSRYTQNNCLQSCLLRRMFSECGAVPDTMRQHVGSKLNVTNTNLTESQTSECLYRTLQAAFLLPPRNCNCPYACYDVLYNPLTQKYDDRVRQWNFTIAYQSLTVTEVKEEPLNTETSVLSSFGGFIGLLLGASVLSIVEIILVVILVPVRAVYNIGK